MAKLGYEYDENYIAPNSSLFYKVGPDGQKVENIHVCERASYKISEFLDQRDFLRSHSEWRKRYSDLKEKLYKKFPDNYPAYREGKSKLLDELGDVAKKWKASEMST